MSKKIICWDSSVIISLILGDYENEKDRIQNIQTIMGLVENEKYGLIVSTLIYPEVLAVEMSSNATDKFDEVMGNKEIIKTVAANVQIAKRAQKIRNAKKSIKTPDAIHLATAIVHKAECFHTFDRQLLRLNKKEAVDSLAITGCTIEGTSGTLL